MGYRWIFAFALLGACGGDRSGPVAAPANRSTASPIGGWTAPGMILCVGDHGFGVTGKTAAKAAGLAARKACTWSDDGTGHCSGDGDMHTAFDLTWKLAGDQLTLSQASDLVQGPVTFQRDPNVACQ